MKWPAANPRVLHILPDLSVGGGQIVVLRHLSVLAARGRRPLVAYCHPRREMESQFLAADIELVDLDVRGPASFPRAARRLRDVVKTKNIEVIHTHGTPTDKFLGHLTVWLSKVKHVTSLHGNPPHTWGGSVSSLRSAVRALKQTWIIRADWWLNRRDVSGVLCVSDAVRQSWRPWLEHPRLRNRVVVEVIYSGIPVQEYAELSIERRELLRKELLGNHTGPLLLGVSRLASGKDVHVTVEVLARLSDQYPTAVLALAGDGPEKSNVTSCVATLGLEDRVRFLGRRSDVPQLLQAADVLVFPSKNEGFGLVVLEALASALPVVCYDLPSLTQIRHGNSAVSVAREHSVESLSEQVKHILSLSPTERRAIGESGRRTVTATWSAEAAADEYEALYRRVVERAPSDSRDTRP